MSEYVELQLGEKTYRAAPCGFDLELAAERHLYELRERDFQKALRLCQDAPEAVQRIVVSDALSRLSAVITREYVLYWQSSPSGSAWYLWFHIQKCVQGFTLEDAEALLPLMTAAHWAQLNLADAAHLGIPTETAEAMSNG